MVVLLLRVTCFSTSYDTFMATLALVYRLTALTGLESALVPHGNSAIPAIAICRIRRGLRRRDGAQTMNSIPMLVLEGSTSYE